MVPQINEERLNAIMGQFVNDLGSSLSSTLTYLGQKLGLFTGLAESGPATPAELADRTGTVERYVREWLMNQAASGYVTYDSETGRYFLSPEQTITLTDEESPFFIGGGFYII